jgi:hypothetical protein
MFFEVGKTQDLPSKIGQTLGDALMNCKIYLSIQQLLLWVIIASAVLREGELEGSWPSVS